MCTYIPIPHPPYPTPSQCILFLFKERAFDFIAFHGKLFFFHLFILFIYFWLCWVFVAAYGFSLVAASMGYSLLWCVGFSLQWLLLLQSTGSRLAGSVVTVHGLSLLRGMWDIPGPGLEPVSPALAGRFLTTAPPGKP